MMSQPSSLTFQQSEQWKKQKQNKAQQYFGISTLLYTIMVLWGLFFIVEEEGKQLTGDIVFGAYAFLCIVQFIMFSLAAAANNSMRWVFALQWLFIYIAVLGAATALFPKIQQDFLESSIGFLFT